VDGWLQACGGSSALYSASGFAAYGGFKTWHHMVLSVQIWRCPKLSSVRLFMTKNCTKLSVHWVVDLSIERSVREEGKGGALWGGRGAGERGKISSIYHFYLQKQKWFFYSFVLFTK
jgi:hypothetical protein